MRKTIYLPLPLFFLSYNVKCMHIESQQKETDIFIAVKFHSYTIFPFHAKIFI